MKTHFPNSFKYWVQNNQAVPKSEYMTPAVKTLEAKFEAAHSVM